MAIILSSSTPSHGSTDYFVNKSVELIFNKAIATTSLSNNVFSIIDVDAGTVVPLTISHGINNTSKVVLLPSTNLKENTQYRILVVGTDQTLGYSLVAQDAEALTATIYIEFSTGSTVYKIDSTIQKDSSSLTLEGDLFLPTNVKALGFDFTIEKVRPKNNIHGVEPSLTGDNTIKFTFTKNLWTGQEDYTEWLDIVSFPLLDTSMYLATSGQLGVGNIPSHSISVTGQVLTVAFSSSLPNNVGIQISILDKVRSIDNDYYSGKLEYSINTKLYPEIYGVQSIKREVREIVDTYTEDYIGALLFKNTIWAWERVGRSFSLDSPTFAAKQYIIYSTILDLMEDKEYSKYVVAGTRRQLGDLGVSVDSIIGRIAMKVAKYQKAKDNAFESIVAGWQFRIGHGIQAYNDAAATVNRLWWNINGKYVETRYVYYQDDVPASNVDWNRYAKTNNPIW
jgi:hypothetical protein